MSRNALVCAVLALLLAILAGVGYRLAPRAATADATLAASSCDPGLQACAAALPGGGQLELAITPRPIRPLQPLELSVKLSGLAASRVEIDFAGADMQMAYNRPVLERAGELFVGRATLPLCISGSMVWEVTALITTKDRQVAVPFRTTVAGH